MSDDTVVLLGFPSVGRKKLTAAFDGGRITSDGGVMLLAAAERRIGLAERLAALISDPRNPLLVTHTVADILRARMLAIACGYEDADDPDHLGNDPGFKLACGRLPDSGRDLCSQPTMSHWENRPSLREVIRLTFGSRVDCYAWGKSIDTTDFGGTSGPLCMTLRRGAASAILTFAADQRPPERRDAGWKKLRDDIPRTVRWAADKEAGTEVTAAAQAAASSLGNDAAPPPPPPPGAGRGAPPPQGQPQPGGRVVLRNRNPKHAGNLANVITFLLQHPALIGCVMFDRMACGISLRQALPGTGTLITPRPWIDDDTSRLQDFSQRECHMARVGKETVQQGAEAVAQMYPFHPVQDYLRGRVWDGTPRADTWLTQYLGVEPSEYAKATGRMWLIGMVARIEQPGCKFDYMLILEGLQGTLKSQVCVALCGPWVSDQSLDIRHDARAASQLLRNKWLVEVSELTFFRQADVETLKAFITRTHEQYLPRYARNEVIEPRQCGFLGTTNQDVYLHDPTGNRRFWPHRTGKIDVRALLRDRDQLWAEVVAAYHGGEHWWPGADFEARVIQPEQAARYDADGWTPLIEQYLTGKSQVTLIDVFRRALADPYDANRPELPPERFDRKAQIRVREILQNLGWKRGQRTDTDRLWVKPP